MLISEGVIPLKISAREAPDFLLQRLMLESAREFFRKSRVWRQCFRGNIVPGTRTYSFTLPTDSLAHDIISAKLETTNEVLEYIRDAGRAYMEPEQSVAYTGAKYITIEGNNKFTLIPPPIIAEFVNLNVILTLTRTALNIEDNLFEEYEEVFRDGALYRLFEMPMESWSNPKMSQHHHRKFLAGIAMARQRAEESGTPGVRSMSFAW